MSAFYFYFYFSFSFSFFFFLSFSKEGELDGGKDNLRCSSWLVMRDGNEWEGCATTVRLIYLW